jgi:hypothetical protein
VEIPEAIIEPVVEPEEPADVHEHYPLNENDEQDNGGVPQLSLNPNLVMLQTIERMARNLKQLNANAAP